jgi:uncharacterized protein YndB with AHSA1/START domain
VLLAVLAGVPTGAQARDTSYVMGSGERVLRIETDVAAPVEEVWKAFATGEGLSRWLAADLAVDLKIGGAITPRDAAAGRLGTSGVAALDIVNYLERELITFRVHLDDRFSETIREDDDRLQEIVRLVPAGANGTRVVTSMVGWGTSRIWDDAYAFFRKRLQDSYGRLASAYAR